MAWHIYYKLVSPLSAGVAIKMLLNFYKPWNFTFDKHVIESTCFTLNIWNTFKITKNRFSKTCKL